MAPKKAAAETRSSPSQDAEQAVMADQRADVPEEVSKVVRKVSPHPPTMEMVKEALKELDQRKGVSTQAIRTFIKEKYTTVDETRLKTMVRKALIKGLESGTFVRPANSAATTTGAQGRFRLAVRKPKDAKPAKKSKEAKENANPNVGKAKEPKAKPGDTKVKPTKKTKSAAEGDKPKKDGAVAPKVAPAKKPKAKRAAGTADEGEPKTKKTSQALKGERGESGKTTAAAKKAGKKAAQKAEEGTNEGAEVSLPKKGGKKVTQKAEEGSEAAEALKKGGRKAAQKVTDGGGEQNDTAAPKATGRKGKRTAEK